MTKTTVLSLAVALVAIFNAGCNSGVKLATVTGTVTLDGKPTEGLEVEFAPKTEDTARALGFTQADGTYTLHYPGDDKTGAPLGEHIVRIRGAERDDAPPLTVAPKYNTNSELTVTVEGGENKFDFDVTSK